MGGAGQTLDLRVRVIGLVDRAFSHIGRLGDLAGNFLDRTRQFLGRRGDGLHVGRRLFGGTGDRGRPFIGAVGDLRHGRRRRRHFGRRFGQGLQKLRHIGVERAGQGLDLAATLLAPFLGFPFAGGKVVGLDHAFLEHQNGPGHVADLVAVFLAWDVDGLVAAGKGFHGRRQGGHGPRDAVADQQRRQNAQQDADPGYHQGQDHRRLHGFAGGRAQGFLFGLQAVPQIVHQGRDIGADETDGAEHDLVALGHDLADFRERGFVLFLHGRDFGGGRLAFLVEQFVMQFGDVFLHYGGGCHGLVEIVELVGRDELVGV